MGNVLTRTGMEELVLCLYFYLPFSFFTSPSTLSGTGVMGVQV